MGTISEEDKIMMTTGMRKREVLNKEMLNFLFYYKDGELYWRAKPSYSTPLDQPAGTVNGGGFREVRVNTNRYRVDLLIWIMHYGIIESGFKLAHLDEDKLNCKINNLFLVRA